MNKEKALKEIDELLIEIKEIRSKNVGYSDEYDDYIVDDATYEAFRLKVITFFKIVAFNQEDDNLDKLRKLYFNNLRNLTIIEKMLINLRKYINNELVNLVKNDTVYNKDILDSIFSRFHNMVKTLRNRYNNRHTLDVKDEYDVQDLLYSILQIFFKDIRKEEWTPSYAGNCSRVDFLLKQEKVVIEVKKTRSTMKDKDLGEQLIIDIAKYKAHPDCKRLICFVYDPDGRIVNPEGIVKDLEKDNKEFVKIYINP